MPAWRRRDDEYSAARTSGPVQLQGLTRRSLDVARSRRSHECARHGDRLRGARTRQGARGQGQVDHQSRHRPAGFPHARSRRRGRHQGLARRSSRLHARERNPAAARSGGQGSAPPAQGRGLTGADPRGSRRQGDDVLRDPDVRRTRRRDHLSEPRLPDLRERDQVLRRHRRPDAAEGSERFRVRRRRGARPDHRAHAAHHRELAGQSDRRHGAARRDRQTGERPGAAPASCGHVGRDLRPDAL